MDKHFYLKHGTGSHDFDIRGGSDDKLVIKTPNRLWEQTHRQPETESFLGS